MNRALLISRVLPGGLTVLAAAALVWWFSAEAPGEFSMRVPGTDRPPQTESDEPTVNPVTLGRVVRGPVDPADHPGSWPHFRGERRDGVSRESTKLNPEPGPSGWPLVWSLPVGEGYAGPIVSDGRVYLMDYDRENQQDALRCFSFDTGQEIWRYPYPLAVKRNHGMSRTVCAMADNVVVSFGPKCHVMACNAQTGELLWTIDLVAEYGAKVPAWYAGQCPFIDGDRVILAPGGDEVMMMAVELKTGRVIWTTPNEPGWQQTHSSIVKMRQGEQAMYAWCGSGGVIGVDAETGGQLWLTTEWKISIATVPTPVVIDESRLLLSGGYNAGAMMLQITGDAESGYEAQVAWRLKAKDFGATQQTPILYKDHIFGVRPNGEAVCLDLAGQIVWASGPEHKFGIGPFIIADDLLWLVDDDGLLTVADASPDGWNVRSQFQALDGHEAWGPIAIAGGRMIVRDLTEMRCYDISAR